MSRRTLNKMSRFPVASMFTGSRRLLSAAADESKTKRLVFPLVIAVVVLAVRTISKYGINYGINVEMFENSSNRFLRFMMTNLTIIEQCSSNTI